MAGSGVTITSDRVPLMLAAVERLTNTEVLVGVPGDANPREGGEIGNAALAYIHEFGSPEANIPARPFLRPGIAAAMPAIGRRLFSAARTVLTNLDDKGAADKALVAVGLTAQNAVRAYINRGVPPPLAEATLEKRMGTKGKPKRGARMELARRATGAAPGVDLAKPLIWTGQLRSSITFVLRKRR